jgi:hypothetical protein
MNINFQEPDGIGETPFMQSIKYIVVGGIKYTKEEIHEYIKDTPMEVAYAR